jgi:uncharacterized phage protein gp47/JayE
MVTIPTTKQLFDDIKANLQAELGINIPVFGKGFLNALAIVQAAKLKLFYYAIAFVQKNIFVDTADKEAIGGTLERWGRIKLGRNPFPATQGVYTITVTGTVASLIPASTTFKSNDSSQNPGKLFILDNAFTLATNPDTISVRALESGAISRLNIGEFLTATAPIAGVDSLATVTAETTVPTAAETLEEYRAKTLESFRLEPEGGAGTDYRLWSKDVSAVKQAYPYAKSNDPNIVEVFVEATVASSIDSKGTPSPTTLTDVRDVIEFDPDTSLSLSQRGRRPLGVFDVEVKAVDVLDVDIDIASFVDSTPEKVTAIFNSIKSLIDGIRPFVSGIDVLSEQNDNLSVNSIIYAIQLAVPGSVFGAVTLTVDGNVVNSYQFIGGEIPFLNSVNYI